MHIDHGCETTFLYFMLVFLNESDDEVLQPKICHPIDADKLSISEFWQYVMADVTAQEINAFCRVVFIIDDLFGAADARQ